MKDAEGFVNLGANIKNLTDEELNMAVLATILAHMPIKEQSEQFIAGMLVDEIVLRVTGRKTGKE